MSEKNRFHPIAILVYLVKSVRGFIFLYFLLFLNMEGVGIYRWLSLIGLTVALLFYAVYRYLTQSYQISADKIILYQGLFRKHETDIPYERIQTIKQRQWFFLRPFEVSELLIETAGGSGNKAEASLPAVSDKLLEQIESYRNRTEPAENEPSVEMSQENGRPKVQPRKEATNVLYQVTTKQIILFGLTDLSVFAVGFAVIAFAQEVIPESWISSATDLTQMLLQAGVIVMLLMVFLLLVVLTLVSLARNFFNYYQFNVQRSGETLTIINGLLERKTQKIPLTKIQGIVIHQQLVRKLLGIVSVELLLAGEQQDEGEGSMHKKVYLLPIINEAKLYQTLNQILPEWDFSPPEIQFTSQRRLWYFWRWWVVIVLPIAIIAFFWQHWVAYTALIFLAVCLGINFLDAQLQGFAIKDENVICVQRFQGLTKIRTFVERRKIQSFSTKTTKWLFPKKIGHMAFKIKTGASASRIQLRFIEADYIQELRAFYLHKD